MYCLTIVRILLYDGTRLAVLRTYVSPRSDCHQDYFEEGLTDAVVVETLCSQQFHVSLASVDPKQEQVISFSPDTSDQSDRPHPPRLFFFKSFSGLLNTHNL